LTKGTEIKQGEDKIGINTKFVIKKNKLAAPFRSYIIPIIFGKGVDYYTDAVSFCETLGIIKKNGAFYKFEGETLGQGRNAAAEFLRNNKEILDRIITTMYNILNRQSTIVLEDKELEDVLVD
jgi:recombination protein RecA